MTWLIDQIRRVVGQFLPTPPPPNQPVMPTDWVQDYEEQNQPEDLKPVEGDRRIVIPFINIKF